KRNLNSIDKLLDAYSYIPLSPKQYKYLLVVRTLFEQQKQMYATRTRSIDDRIVSIHQPHVRPIVRGKTQAKVEFGAKIHVSVIDGICFLDELKWDAFNEGSHMMAYVEQYHKRFGCYPRELLADQIYCTRANRAALKEKGIKLIAKPLGRPPAVPIHVSPGERNPVEGKFGQAKIGYGLNRVKARLKETSEPWIACIFLVLNLVKLAGVALPRLMVNTVMSFSATGILVWLTSNVGQIRIPMGTALEIMKSEKFNLKIAA
ncbi:transposase, partial [Geofilum rubicundum]